MQEMRVRTHEIHSPCPFAKEGAAVLARVSLLCALVAAALLSCACFAPAARAEAFDLPAAWIASDKPDYAPGEAVALTGGGWTPGEAVHIRVNDDAGETWSREVDVAADETGGLTDQFSLPSTFVALYRVTVTSASGVVATTTFTDGNIKVRSANNRTFGYTVRGFTNTTTCASGGGGTATHTADSNGQNESSNAGDSILITANQNANAPNASAAFLNWSNPDGLTITAGTLSSRTICVAGFATGDV